MNTRSGARDQSSHSGMEPAQGGDSMAQLALLMSQMVNQQEAREERRLRLEEQKMELEIRRIDNEGAREADRVAAAT